MTNGSSDRITQIEQLLQETVQITRSNAKTIQGILDTQVEARLETASINEAIQRLTTLNDGVVNLLASLDSDRPTILRKLSSIENKVDKLTKNSGDQTQS